MASRRRCIDFEKMIAPGESPYDFCAQTANGSARATGSGWNRADQQYEWPQAETGGPWPAGRSNRTAE